MGTRSSQREAPSPWPAARLRCRDRRGRGVRGPLTPPQLRLARTRAERFDDLVLEAIELLERRWAAQLTSVNFAVEDVPPVAELPDGTGAGDRADPVPMSRHIRAQGSSPSRIVLYRRPLEARAAGDELAAAVYEVVVEEFANVLGLEPQTVDPSHSDEH